MDFLIAQEDQDSFEISHPGASHFFNYSYIQSLAFSTEQMTAFEDIIQAIVTLGAADFFNEGNAQRLTSIVSEYEPLIGLLYFFSYHRDKKNKLSSAFIEKLLFEQYPKQVLLEILTLIRLSSPTYSLSNNFIEHLILKKNNLLPLLKLMRKILLHMPSLLRESNIDLLVDYSFNYSKLLDFYTILFNPKWFDTYYSALLELCATESFFIGLLDKREALAPVVTVMIQYLKTQNRCAHEQRGPVFNKEKFLALVNIKTDREEWALACQIFAAKSNEPLALEIIYQLAALSGSRLNDVVQAALFLNSRYSFELNLDMQHLLTNQNGLVATLVVKVALHQDRSTDNSKAYLTLSILNLLRCKPVKDLDLLCHILHKSFDKSLHISSYFFRELLGFREQSLIDYEERIMRAQERLFPEVALYQYAARVSPPTTLVTFIKAYRMEQLSEMIISQIVAEETSQVIAIASHKKIINLCEKMAQQLLPSSNTDVIFRFLQFQAWLQVKSAQTAESKAKGYQFWGLLKKISERALSRSVYDAQLTKGQWIDMMLSLVYQILRSYEHEKYYWPMLSERRLLLVARAASTESFIIAEKLAQELHSTPTLVMDRDLHNSPRFRLGVSTLLTEKELSDMRKNEYRPGKHVHFDALPVVERDASFDSGIFYSRRVVEEKSPQPLCSHHVATEEEFQKKLTF